MTDHKGCIRGYHRSSKAWYAKGNLNENVHVNFGMYDEGGEGTSGAMMMEWICLSNALYARLECFEDSWSSLSLFTDLIQKMGEVDSAAIQEEQFCKMLDECGFKDLTAYKDPEEGKEIPKEDMVNISISKSKAIKLGLIENNCEHKSKHIEFVNGGHKKICNDCGETTTD